MYCLFYAVLLIHTIHLVREAETRAKRLFFYIVCETPTPANGVVCENENDYKNSERTLKPWVIISRAC